MERVLSASDRYYKALIADPESATSQDLLNALDEVERLHSQSESVLMLF